MTIVDISASVIYLCVSGTDVVILIHLANSRGGSETNWFLRYFQTTFGNTCLTCEVVKGKVWGKAKIDASLNCIVYCISLCFAFVHM